MKIFFQKTKLTAISEPILVLPIFQKEKFAGQVAEIDKKLGGFVSEIIKEGYFDPELNQVHVLYTRNLIGSKKIVLIGLGEKKTITEEKLYNAIATAVAYLGKTQVRECAVYLGRQSPKNLQNLAEVSILALYKIHLHKTNKKDTHLSKINFIIENDYPRKELSEIAQRAEITAENICYARDLVNHPSNFITPKKLADEAKKLAKGKITEMVFGEQDIKKMKMNLLLSVSRGSEEEAQLIILDYKPKKFTKTIALVGKGVTFDTGGISLKPFDKMAGMNMDMAGAAAILGTFRALTYIEPQNTRIIGVIPATENMLSGKAQKPGDVWKSYSGKTVEVLNTDAEGRLVLADALSYVQDKYQPNYLIDIATLTGACMIALGYEYTGLFGNNQTLINGLMKVSRGSYEKLWPLPICDAFREEMKGEIADLKNVGNGREGGASTGAAFIEAFVDKKTAWIHLDIAGPAIREKSATAFQPKGGTGTGTKTLIELVRKLAK